MTAGPARALVWAGLLLALGACALVPDELNLSPLYRHRLDRDGSVRELDVLWPLFFYRQTEDGGIDFRVRPLYRYVSDGPADVEGDEHQFLWPLGRVHRAHGETLARLFPLWWYKARADEHGLRETDWYVALLIWGGSRADSGEDYFGVLPLWADIPDFLTYDRFQVHLFPLHVGLEKGSMRSDIWLWPLIGWGSDSEGSKYWHRALPLYSAVVDPERYERYSLLWPFVHWGYENLDFDHPVHTWFLFPLFGRQTGETVDAWTALWPLFSKLEMQDKLYRLDLLWPIFRYYRNTVGSQDLLQWWVWPLVGRTETPRQRAWTFCWPLVWLREYFDPDGRLAQDWVLPFYWRSHREWKAGGEDDFVKLWPLLHTETKRDGSGEWSLLSPWPWHSGNAYGVDEAYGWLWTLARRRYTADSDAFHLAGHLYTTARREGRRLSSVPFLFNHESDEDGSVLRLFQLLPIPLGGGSAEAPAPDGDG